MVHLDQDTSAWVNWKTFEIDASLVTADILRALIDNWAYHDHYAGQDVADQDHHSVHGAYRLECIVPSAFHPVRPAIADSLLQSWAEALTGNAPSAAVQRELDSRVYPMLDDAELLQLPDLRPEAEHEWGYVVGQSGFLEYVAIARDKRRLVAIVASDD